jgi:2-amino-4-hydroxy-6-hydroxymethyldihydropteridine diphosphokinase
MPVAYLGLGSNLDAEQNLQLACRELRNRFSLQQISAAYRSKALGFDGADFLNAVACIETELTPQELCGELELIHDLAERTRRSEKFIARTLDIDLLLYDQLILNDPPVRLPREDVLQYSFVLRPLAEIAPDYRHPVTGKLISDHWREFDAASHPLTAVDLVLDL